MKGKRTPVPCPACGVLVGWEDEHMPGGCPTVVEVVAYPEEWYHLHGKALSGLRHSHPLRDGEDRDDPGHEHVGFPIPDDPDVDSRGIGAALYWTWDEPPF